MKVTVSLEFNSLAEAQQYLNTHEAGTVATVSATGAVKEKEAEVVEVKKQDKRLKDFDKKSLQEMCDSAGITYNSKNTKAELIEWLTNGKSEVAQYEGEIEDVAKQVAEKKAVEAEVVEEVPRPSATAIDETPATVSVVDKNALIKQFTDSYTNAVSAGVDEETLKNNVASHLTNLGHPGVRLSLLPDEALATFVPLFVEQTSGLVQQVMTPQAQPSNSFI